MVQACGVHTCLRLVLKARCREPGIHPGNRCQVELGNWAGSLHCSALFRFMVLLCGCLAPGITSLQVVIVSARIRVKKIELCQKSQDLEDTCCSVTYTGITAGLQTPFLLDFAWDHGEISTRPKISPAQASLLSQGPVAQGKNASCSLCLW